MLVWAFALVEPRIAAAAESRPLGTTPVMPEFSDAAGSAVSGGAPSKKAVRTPTSGALSTLPRVTAAVSGVALAKSEAWNPPLTTLVAAAQKRYTPAFSSPSATKPIKTFDNAKNFSGRAVFVVLENQGENLRVQLPMRPNEMTGFVRSKDVSVYQHDYAISVSLAEHVLRVYKSGKEIMRETVGVGQKKYPTPTGLYYTTELARPANPRGSYGPYAIGLSGYSNVLLQFGKGDGQIGIHGTNQPKRLGTDVSHGCIRLSNAAITRLAGILPQGVPVRIVK